MKLPELVLAQAFYDDAMHQYRQAEQRGDTLEQLNPYFDYWRRAADRLEKALKEELNHVATH